MVGALIKMMWLRTPILVNNVNEDIAIVPWYDINL